MSLFGPKVTIQKIRRSMGSESTIDSETAKFPKEELFAEHKYKNTSMLTCQKLQFSREVALRWPYLLATKAATQILIFAAAFILIGTDPVHSDA